MTKSEVLTVIAYAGRSLAPDEVRWRLPKSCPDRRSLYSYLLRLSVLDSAAEYDYLAVNLARGVKFPPQAPQKEPEILTAEAFAQLLGHLREPFKTMVAVAVLTGLRVGELLALRWRAVDLASGTLRVSESVYEGKVQTPKSEKGVRTIPIGPLTRWLLQAHCQRSVRTGPEGLVFPNRRGTPYGARNLLQRVLQPAARVAGINRINWHQFRHIHSSLLHDLGVPIKVAQQQLGHAAVETTLKIYTHAIPETHRRAVANLEQALFADVLFPNVPKLPGAQKVPVC